MLEFNIAYIADWYFGSDCQLQVIVQYLNCRNYISFSPWDWDQIGIKLGTKHVVYLKLRTFTLNKDVYVNRLERVFFDM